MMSYPTDLSDAEFRHIEPYLAVANRRGRPKIHAPREILNADFYVIQQLAMGFSPIASMSALSTSAGQPFVLAEMLTC
jgi:transposase